MICLNPILKSPLLAALVSGCLVMLYFILMSYSPNLPPAVLCSVAVAYFVYFAMGGTVMCKNDGETSVQNPVYTSEPAHSHGHIHTHNVVNVPEAVATIPIGSNRVKPTGKPVYPYKTF